MQRGKTALLLCAVLFVQACGDDEPTTSSQSGNNHIAGSVVMSNGKPLSNAQVRLLFHATQRSSTTEQASIAPNPAASATRLSFEVPVQSAVNVRVLDPLLGSVVRTLVNTVLPAGQHTVDWDLKANADSVYTLRNGLYIVRLDIGGTVRTLPLLVNAEENSTPFAVTDSTGSFFIDYRYIPRDSVFTATNEVGTVLGRYGVVDSVTVLVRLAGYTRQIKSVKINRAQPTNLKFIF